jgi:outer membrane receptor for ferrienterochelin and colicin
LYSPGDPFPLAHDDLLSIEAIVVSVTKRRTGRIALGLILACSGAKAADEPPRPPDASLDTIVVSGQKLSVETRIDRKIYSVPSDVQSTFGSLSDVLTVIPSIEVDGDGVVSLRGDPKVLILIDGKPSTQFSGPSAGQNLQSIPAKDIERIEVLTTPPPQFKADGAAGVINIILRKKRSKGYAGSIQGSLDNGERTSSTTSRKDPDD